MSAPINGDDLLKQIQPVLPHKRIQVCLRPDLVDRYTENAEQIFELEQEQTQGNRLNPGTQNAAEIEQLRAENEALAEEMDQGSPWFEFEAKPVEDFQALTAKHPPRDNNELDAYSGYDRDAVINVLIRECLVDPVFTDDGWKTLKQTCPPSEWAAMRDAVLEVNGSTVKPPKSRRASRRQPESDNVSE